MICFSAPVGFSTKPGDCMYLPVPCEIKYLDAERSGCKFYLFQWIESRLTFLSLVDMLASAKSNENRTANLLSDMDHLEVAISKLQELLQRISEYVESVLVRKKDRN